MDSIHGLEHVWRLLAQGCSDAEIGRILGLSESRVAALVQALYVALELGDDLGHERRVLAALYYLMVQWGFPASEH